MNAQALNPEVLSTTLENLDREISRIKACKCETELDTLLRAMLGRFAVESYLFVSLRRTEASRESFRCLIGCSPTWCQLYMAKKWFAIDPFIDHALHNSRPIALSDIKAETAGQAELLRTANEHGFRSGMIFPAHAASKSTIGVLYLGSTQCPVEIEPLLHHSRNLFRAMALELFEWWEEKAHAETLVRYQLDKIDVQLLQLEQEGYTADESAKVCGFTTSAVNGRFRRINDKLDVHHKKRALERAVELGILRR